MRRVGTVMLGDGMSVVFVLVYVFVVAFGIWMSL